MNRAITTLLALESQHALWTREVLGYAVWAQLRLSSYHHLLENVPPPLPGARAVARSRRLERARASARDVLTKLGPALRRRDVWVLSSSAYRRTEANGSKENIFAKDLAAQFGERLLFLETTHTVQPARDDVVMLDSLRDLARLSADRIASLLPRVLAQPVMSKPELELNPSFVLREAVFGRIWERLARTLLQYGKPSAVFVLCAYDQHVPFQTAVRRLGIPLIEIQHGVIHESHPGYIFDPGFAGRHAPDHLLVFGKHYGDLLDRHSPYWIGRWSVAGHPWLKAARQLHAQHGSENWVVLFGQNVPAVQQQIRDCARALRRLLGPEVRLVIKPHPAEADAEQAYSGLSSMGIEILPRHADSYELLARCRVAVSVFSTIAIEALAFPCKSVVLRSPHWYDDIRRFIEAGFIQLADNAKDIADLAQSTPDAHQHDIARQLFGAGEASVDFKRLIEQLRSGGARRNGYAPCQQTARQTGPGSNRSEP